MTRRNTLGFSLVEVVLALAIVVFAGFALVGLFALGLQNSSDSKQRFQAATIAEAICSTRRAVPTTDISSAGTGTQPYFPLPVLSAKKDNITTLQPVYLTWNGNTPSVNDPTPRFGLLYSIIAPTGYTPPVPPSGSSVAPGTATVYLYIYWPAAAPPLAANTSHFELTTTFALP